VNSLGERRLAHHHMFRLARRLPPARTYCDTQTSARETSEHHREGTRSIIREASGRFTAAKARGFLHAHGGLGRFQGPVWAPQDLRATKSDRRGHGMILRSTHFEQMSCFGSFL
jgi:hypothetical protein